MIRETLPALVTPEPDFEWRGRESTRLESFSDAVFAFAVTLLVVSLEVPHSYAELLLALRGFVPFAACFAVLLQVWRAHCRFFRRYGLETPQTVLLNGALLFFLLFYIYPLKYLFGLAFNATPVEASQARVLLLVFGAGYSILMLLFALLYRHAWRLREPLALNAVERELTRASLLNHLAGLAVGAVCMLLAITVPERWVGATGLFYGATPLYLIIADIRTRRRLALIKSAAAAA